MRAGIRVLGPLEAEVEGARADLGGPLQRAVLALLLMERGRVVSVDRMIDQLWRGEPPPRAIASLQAYVSNLRRILEPGRARRAQARILISAPPGYALRLPDEAVDAWRFESLLAAARFRLHQAVLAWLRHATATGPVAVLLDDLHQADTETLALLETVAAGLAGAGSPLLLMAAYRPAEAGGLEQALAVLARRSPTRLPLGGLPAPDAAALISSAAEPLARALYEMTGALAADVWAVTLAAAGRAGEARRRYEEGAAISPRPDFFQSVFATFRAMAVIAVGDRAAAEALVTDLTPVAGLLAGAASTALAMQPVAQTLGELSAFLGRPEAAARHFATAEQVARRWNSPHWTALALAVR